MNGYIGYGDSLALKWDNIIVHESGHEWFGNNISAKDLSDMWVHEGFTAYTETLFTEYHYGKDAGNVYAINSRQEIQNAFPVIGYYGVNDEIAMRNQDIYAKGSNLLHTIRHSIDNDPLFRNLLIGLNKTFYHQTVTSLQVENYFSQQAAFDYSKVFDQYLRAVQIPAFEFYFSDDKKTVFYRYTNCVNGFNLPLVLKDENEKIKILPLESWKSIAVSTAQQLLFNASSMEKAYYIQALEATNKTR
jgi:aminopeptidase N